MTYKDLLKKDHPEKVNSKYDGGCSMCPHDYNYCLPEDCLCHKTGFKNFDRKVTCTRCWLQEVPGARKKEIKRLPPEKKKEWKATWAVFRDGHKERIVYSTEYRVDFVEFATESGVYVWNDKHHTMYSCTPIKAKFCVCRTYRDTCGNLATMYLDASNIDHIEFEEVEV